MMHVVQYLLESDRSYGTKVGTPCKQVFLIPTMEIEPGAFVQEDDGQKGWCPVCQAHHQGREVDMGLPTDMGTINDGNGIGPAEESELGELEGDGEMGAAEEVFPDDPKPTFGR